VYVRGCGGQEEGDLGPASLFVLRAATARITLTI
jgi:hypothetical protein